MPCETKKPKMPRNATKATTMSATAAGMAGTSLKLLGAELDKGLLREKGYRML